jgi:transcriptional regulator with XRE-family HTH domain
VKNVALPRHFSLYHAISEGEDWIMGTPEAQHKHHGRLIASYRVAKGWSQPDLAEVMHLSMRTVQRMERMSVIKNLKRRELLVGLLGIPAVQLGLGTSPELVKPPLKFNSDLMTLMEDTVQTKWNMYRMGGPLGAASGLDILLQQLTTLAEEAQGTPWHERTLGLLSISYRLQGCVLGDSDYDKAILSCQTAYEIAYEINDPSLMASSFMTHGIMLGRQGKLTEALTYAQGALARIEKTNLPLVRGDVLAMQAELYAKANQPQEYQRCIGLAERTLEARTSLPDRANYSLTVASLLASKASGALILQDYDRAYRLLDKSLSTYSPTLTPSRAKLFIKKAEACYGLGLIDECATCAEESLFMARAIGSQRTITRIIQLYTILARSKWKNELYVAHLGMLLRSQL